jgi:chromate transporter
MSPQLLELTRTMARVGLLSFGGPAAQIAMLHREAVERRAWMTDREFLEALNVCTLLPGPEATQLATAIGVRRAGTVGGIVAGTMFVIPGAACTLALAAAHVAFAGVPQARGVLLGLTCAALALIAQAVWRVGTRTICTPWAAVIALAALVVSVAGGVGFPWIVVGAGVLGLVMGERLEPRGQAADAAGRPRPPIGPTLRHLSMVLGVWLAPLAALGLVLGSSHPLTLQAVVFAKGALVTFGGAYAVLGYFRQQFVDVHGWLDAPDVLAGLALAETTPGPLILTGQFMAYVGAARAGLGVPMSVLAAGVFLWATFVPAIGIMTTLTPWTPWIASKPKPRAALNGITAAVVGVIAALGLWLAARTLFVAPSSDAQGWGGVPAWSTVRPEAVVLCVLALVLLVAARWGVPAVLAVSVACGVALGAALH